MSEQTHQHDYQLRLRGPAEPNPEAARRLRAALKGLLRRYGLRCIEIKTLRTEQNPQTPSETQHASHD